MLTPAVITSQAPSLTPPATSAHCAPLPPRRPPPAGPASRLASPSTPPPHPPACQVRAGNVGALALYEGLGFQPVGRRPGYYSDDEDAVLLNKEVL